MKLKVLAAIGLTVVTILAITPLASAHVVVTPKAAAPAERVTFSVSVPNEKNVPVVGLRVTIPAGLQDVTPTVHPGWTIETTKTGDAITSIVWSGGQIPAGQRDDFTFRAQTPEKAGEVQWKAFQTYADGSTVAWDQTPSATEDDNESESTGPYSVTNVTNTPETTSADTTNNDQAETTALIALGISLVALVLSIYRMLRSK